MFSGHPCGGVRIKTVDSSRLLAGILGSTGSTRRGPLSTRVAARQLAQVRRRWRVGDDLPVPEVVGYLAQGNEVVKRGQRVPVTRQVMRRVADGLEGPCAERPSALLLRLDTLRGPPRR